MNIFLCTAVHIFLGSVSQPKSVVLAVLRCIIQSNESQMIHFRSTLLFGCQEDNLVVILRKPLNGILSFSSPESMWTKIIVINKRSANPLFQLPVLGGGDEGDLEMLQDVITVFYFVSPLDISVWRSFLKNYAKNPLLQGH